jgi:hypothetical protein
VNKSGTYVQDLLGPHLMVSCFLLFFPARIEEDQWVGPDLFLSRAREAMLAPDRPSGRLGIRTEFATGAG